MIVPVQRPMRWTGTTMLVRNQIALTKLRIQLAAEAFSRMGMPANEVSGLEEARKLPVG